LLDEFVLEVYVKLARSSKCMQARELAGYPVAKKWQLSGIFCRLISSVRFVT